MKGTYNRFKQRQQRREQTVLCNEMATYAEVLKQLTDVAGDGKSFRQDNQPLQRRIRPNEVVAVICDDNQDYFRTIRLQKNELTGGFTPQVSLPIYGSVPPSMEVVSQEQAHKQLRELNGYGSLSSLNAFPFFNGGGKYNG